MATPFDALDWRKLSREALDNGLNNSVAVGGSAGYGLPMIDGEIPATASAR